MRAFLAIELPEAVRSELSRAQRHLRDALGDEAVGWTPAENWHLTLRFLGEVADPGPVVAAARAACAAAAPLELSLGALGSFGARVLWAGIEGPGAPALVDLVGALEQALAPLGFAAEGRPYSPHVTLGRVRDPGGRKERARRRPKRPANAGRPTSPAPVGPVVRAAPRPAPCSFLAAEVVLMESRLSPPRPATYVPHAHLPLGAAGGDTRQDSRAGTD
jgi:2'-5' RNA ligase